MTSIMKSLALRKCLDVCTGGAAVLLVTGGLLGGSAASALAEELTTASVFTGNQAYSGVGIYFTVNTPITVTGLGMFDSGQDGFAAAPGAPLTAELWSVTDFNAGTGTSLATATFDNGTAGGVGGGTLDTLTGYSFQPITPIDLAAGDYIVAGYGWTNLDPEHNCNVDNTVCDTFNTAGGALTYNASPFGGGSDSPSVMPNKLGFGTNNFFGGPSLQFDVPEPGSMSIVALALAGLGGIRRRLRRRSDI